MNAQIKSENERKYYIDWLRVLAFGLLFIFHSWRPFDHFPWHIKNEEQNFIFDMLTMFTHGWRMFLIFLVSGAGTWFAMRSRKKAFVKDRIKRLIVPFLFGIIFIIPPQRFYELIMFHNFSGNYLDFIATYPSHQLEANMGSSLLLWFGHLGTHIWYLPFLFVITVLTLPLLKKIQNRQLKFTWLKNIMKSNIGVFILVIPMIFVRIILKPIYSEYTDWADFFVYLLPFIYGFLFMSDQEFISIAKSKMYLFLAVGIITSCIFLYVGSQSAQNVQEYLHPSFSMYHIQISILSMIIAYSWIMFFLAFFARYLNFNHTLLIPANTSILPIYILHQTLIIVIGFYVVNMELNIFLKFAIIVLIAIPASVCIYKIIQTNNVLRFLFGLKVKPKKNIIPSRQVANGLVLDK